MVGNSWTHGLLPYRDVYDVKGPFFYLLFGLFAWIRPWSMGAPLVFLAALAFCSLWLAYAVARLHLQRRALAALAAVLSSVLIYLSVAGIPTSFSCEELAVPGVLLLLWLTIRWLRDRDQVTDGWWVLDGIVLGALFWTKYQVIAPWAGMLVACTVLVVRGALPARSLRRVIVLHLAGVAIATVGILLFYVEVLTDMVQAYFLAKRGSIRFATELPAEAEFAAKILTENTGAALVLIAVLVLLLVRTFRDVRLEGLTLTIAFCLSVWASLAFVRHENNLFVPLSFCAVAVPQVLSAAQSRGRVAARAATVGVVAVTAAACVAPLAQAVTSYGLGKHYKRLTCYEPSTKAHSPQPGTPSMVFARTAGDRPILSVGTLFAARSSYIAHLPMRHPFEFVDNSWARTTGADRVQTRYLQDRTFDYVWIHISGVDKFGDLEAQIAGASARNSSIQPPQAAAIVRNYVPILGCNNNILLRAR